MKVDFTQQLKNLDGVGYHESGIPVTLKVLSSAALMANYPGEQITGEEKFQRFELASKIHDSTEAIEVTADDINRLKGLIGRFYGTELVGPAYRVFANATANEAPAAATPDAVLPAAEPKPATKRRGKLSSVPSTTT